MNQQPSPSKGWIVTLAALAANLVLGSLYAWSVIAKALSEQWKWTPEQVGLPFTASTIAFAVTMIFAGRVQDKIGPRVVARLGGIMLGLGLIASAWATTPAAMVITFGIIGGIGIGLGYSATTPPALKWFPAQKKGLISGIVVSGIGLAAVIMAPITRALLANFPISQTFVILGVGTIIFVGIMSFIITNPPAGYVPAGAPAGAKSAGKPTPAVRRDLDWHEMLRTITFWKLWVLMILGAAAGLMAIAQITLIAKNQAGITNATTLMYLPMLLAIFNTCGRLISGFLSDKMGRANTMVLFFLLQAINMFCFHLYTTPPLLFLGVALLGFCYGPIFPLFPSATADFYGMKNLGVNYGLVFTAFGVAGTAATFAGRVVVKHQSYDMAYYVLAGMLILGAILAFTTKAPKIAPVRPEVVAK